MFLLWCMSPLEGSTLIYTRVIRPYFLKHQTAFDNAAQKATDGLSKFADSAMEKGKWFPNKNVNDCTNFEKHSTNPNSFFNVFQ